MQIWDFGGGGGSRRPRPGQERRTLATGKQRIFHQEGENRQGTEKVRGPSMSLFTGLSLGRDLLHLRRPMPHPGSCTTQAGPPGQVGETKAKVTQIQQHQAVPRPFSWLTALGFLSHPRNPRWSPAVGHIRLGSVVPPTPHLLQLLGLRYPSPCHTVGTREPGLAFQASTCSDLPPPALQV